MHVLFCQPCWQPSWYPLWQPFCQLLRLFRSSIYLCSRILGEDIFPRAARAAVVRYKSAPSQTRVGFVACNRYGNNTSGHRLAIIVYARQGLWTNHRACLNTEPRIVSCGIECEVCKGRAAVIQRGPFDGILNGHYLYGSCGNLGCSWQRFSAWVTNVTQDASVISTHCFVLEYILCLVRIDTIIMRSFLITIQVTSRCFKYGNDSV